MSQALLLANDDDDLEVKLNATRKKIPDEYFTNLPHPWIIGFSGGKNSTLVAHLVFEMLLNISPSQRRRTVHVVANDTLVESPLVIGHIKTVQA